MSLLNLYATVTPYLSIVFEPLTIFNHIMFDLISVEHICNQQIGQIHKNFALSKFGGSELNSVLTTETECEMASKTPSKHPP